MMDRSKTPKDILLRIIREKHGQLPPILAENGIDCWIVFIRETAANPDPVIPLVIGSDVVWESAFIFAHKNNTFTKTAIVGNFDAPAEENKGIWDRVIPYVEGISDPLLDVIRGIDPVSIALNYSIDDVVADGLSHGMFLKLSDILADYTSCFTSAAPIIRAVRGRKSATEIELVTKACELTEEINRAISKQLEPGMLETGIQQMFRVELDKHGVIEAWQRDSCPAIDAGPDKVIGHVGPSPNHAAKKGHTLHNDFGVQLHGYCSDLQRMWFFGSETDIPDELQHAFDTVKVAIRKAFDYIKPGLTGVSVDKIARDHIVASGYDEFPHALGHQVGTKAHDGGVILGPLWERYGDTPKGLVEEGHVFTLELHVKTENYGTVSLEENIVVEKNGARFLVPPQEKFILVQD